MGFEIDTSTSACTVEQEFIIDNLKGVYTGEIDKESGLAHGRGLFKADCQSIFICHFEHGRFADGKCLRIDMLSVGFSACTTWFTSDGWLYEKGLKMASDGSIRQGIWFDEVL